MQVPPQPGMVLIGYEVCHPRAGCFRCDGLSPGGLLSGAQVRRCPARRPWCCCGSLPGLPVLCLHQGWIPHLP